MKLNRLTSRRADNPPLPCRNLRPIYPNKNGQGDWLDWPSRILTSLPRVRGIAKLMIRDIKRMMTQITCLTRYSESNIAYLNRDNLLRGIADMCYFGATNKVITDGCASKTPTTWVQTKRQHQSPRGLKQTRE